MSVVHWVRSDGRSWSIPHGRITLNRGTEDVRAVTCKVCVRLILAASCRCDHVDCKPCGSRRPGGGTR